MAKHKRKRRKKYSERRLKAALFALTAASLLLFVIAAFFTFHTLKFTALIDARLRGEQLSQPAWVYAKPFELRKGQRLTREELVATLNDLGYREVPSISRTPASFAVAGEDVHIRRRGRLTTPISVAFQELWVSQIRVLDGDGTVERVSFEPVPVTTLFGEDRVKSRFVPLVEIPEQVVRAILATEDKRFFSHTGLDPIGIVRALVADLRSGEMRQGGSTITQQLVKNYFLTPERTIRRKLLEAYLAILLESRVPKNDILELYLNEVYFGQRGSFGINGVGQAAQIFFGKDVRNLGVAEAALLAAVIRSPNASSPFRYAEEALERRNVVIRQMAEADYIDAAEAQRALEAPLGLVEGAIDRGEAPYFVDTLRRELTERYDVRRIQTSGVRIFSTMDRHLQNAAQAAVVEGMEEIRRRLPKAKTEPPQAALVALVPHTGDVLALVGARSYGVSQFNRAIDAHRQPGSAFKPFVYLAAFETDPSLAPASTVVDEPTTFRQGGRTWRPQNYSRRFEGRVSYRRALALSLNVATAKVGQKTGFENVVSLWEAMGMTSRLEPYPSLVLGAFEVTPLELATAYAVLANGGRRVAPRFFTAIEDGDGRTLAERPVEARPVASAESAYLVNEMMQSVVSFGTAKEIRARGFTARAAGKTGTTNDTRDAWFVGFTPDVLAAVWVGYDDNEPLGLTGSQAALPIWTRFMKAAVSGREKETFVPPPEITFAEIDPASGKLATADCPRQEREAFRKGSAPKERCPLHSGPGLNN